ncbi:hypothetical protein GGD68_008580 [Paraburkholderia fungorum]|uniref:Lipoprotein n=1 Tax=Paraburkholderia fungorum TaxID=134537 RepID=A0AAW3UUC3_9BURK|nr:hypothetical protein [Paraburkholderia fungorum]MBB6201207.1 hypothetical protein [Paraburkholderia fungorum]
MHTFPSSSYFVSAGLPQSAKLGALALPLTLALTLVGCCGPGATTCNRSSGNTASQPASSEGAASAPSAPELYCAP